MARPQGSEHVRGTIRKSVRALMSDGCERTTPQICLALKDDYDYESVRAEVKLMCRRYGELQRLEPGIYKVAGELPVSLPKHCAWPKCGCSHHDCDLP